MPWADTASGCRIVPSADFLERTVAKEPEQLTRPMVKAPYKRTIWDLYRILAKGLLGRIYQESRPQLT